jgi:hypothetical protein
MGTPHEARTWRARTAAAVAVAALLLSFVAACSDDKDDTGTAGSSTTAADGSSTTAGSTTTTAGQAIEGFGDYKSVNYDDPAHWVCRPDQDDVCDTGLDATSVAADGKLEALPFEPADDAPIDCFYVYPTISQDQLPTSDWEASPREELYVTANQAARLGTECRVFAPVYRQFTLASLVGRTSGSGGPKGDAADPYADVLDAFRTYLAEDNGGRGFVLIGHSQGSGLLGRLLKEEIDGNEVLRSHLVAAYLAGSAVAVPEGKDVGGDLTNIPLCRKADQTGCLVSWATFRSTAPPTAASFFGRAGGRTGGTTGAGLIAACVNPAAVLADADPMAEEPLHPYFPSDPSGSILTPDTKGGSWLTDGSKVDTPYVTVPGLVTGKCARTGEFSYFSITVHGDPAGPRADDVPGDLTPEWGMHLIDVNVVMGDIVELVHAQAEAYAG